MKKIYIYPTYTPSRDKSGNLYIKYFHDSFKNQSDIKLINRLWKVGICSMIFNLDAQIFIIQWVDLIPQKKFGKIQFIFFVILIYILKITKKEIIWVLHNKHAHKGKSKIVDKGMYLMAKYSNSVMVHAKEGVSFFNNKYPQYKGKCHYIPHPVYTSKIYSSTNNYEWDYIIWGNISRRKNIIEFIQFARNNIFFNNKKILICGQCNDILYDTEIKKILPDNITYLNKFIEDDELIALIKKSKNILFTYNTSSILSSGALIYSLNFNKPIIGPNAGNFSELSGIVTCYNKFEDIPNLEIKFTPENIQNYLTQNTWENLPNKVLNIL